MAITTCTVSGTIYGPNGSALSGVEVEAYIDQPFFHGDGTLIADYKLSTTTDSTGAWSLTLIETTSVTKTMNVAIKFPLGSGELHRKQYQITVPASGTANFHTLAAGQ
jgi:hypothetical protein